LKGNLCSNLVAKYSADIDPNVLVESKEFASKEFTPVTASEIPDTKDGVLFKIEEINLEIERHNFRI